MTDNSAANIKAGKFVDPLKDWPNDDLMVRKETRAIWRQNRPTAFPRQRKSPMFMRC